MIAIKQAAAVFSKSVNQQLPIFEGRKKDQ
jgi:hypothetical protein